LGRHLPQPNPIQVQIFHQSQGKTRKAKNQNPFCIMKFKTLKSDISNPTILYIADWMALVQSQFKTEVIFENVDELAAQLEAWRVEYIRDQKHLESHWGDQVTVVTYGQEVILVSDQRSGEFIKMYDFDFAPEPTTSRKRPLLILLILTALLMLCSIEPARAESIADPAAVDSSVADFGIFGPRTGAQYAAKMNRSVVKGGKKTIKANRRHTRRGGRR
jgi:hypothetical protein